MLRQVRINGQGEAYVVWQSSRATCPACPILNPRWWLLSGVQAQAERECRVMVGARREHMHFSTFASFITQLTQLPGADWRELLSVAPRVSPASPLCRRLLRGICPLGKHGLSPKDELAGHEHARMFSSNCPAVSVGSWRCRVSTAASRLTTGVVFLYTSITLKPATGPCRASRYAKITPLAHENAR